MKLCEDLRAANDLLALSGLLHSRCATDIEFFAVSYFPHYCTYEFNLFHRDTFQDYKFGERDVRRASAAPRGFAKSTIKALIKPIHDICYGLEKFIVIISNTDAQAVQKLKDIQTELVTNEALISDYGRFIEGKKIGSTDFIAWSGFVPCRLLALGSNTEMRGIRFGNVRPTKIVLDDVEHSTEVESEANREKLSSWYKDVVSKIGDEQTNIEFIGTVLHRQSLLRGLLKNPRYKTREYKAIISWSDNPQLWEKWKDIYCNLDNEQRVTDARNFYLQNESELMAGVEVLWPEKEPYYRLQEEIIETGMRSFMKEKQNSPMSDEEKVFDPDNIWWYEKTEKGLLIEKNQILVPWHALTSYGAIDPSTGQKKVSSNKKPDFSAILSGYQDQRKRLFVDDAFIKRVPPSEFIKKIFELWQVYKYRKFGVETNLFRELLLDNIRDFRKKYEKEINESVSMQFMDIYLTENKEKRIYSIEPKVHNGYILFNKRLQPLFMEQLYDFPKGQHDDGPDCLEMLWGIVNNKYSVQAVDKDLNR